MQIRSCWVNVLRSAEAPGENLFHRGAAEWCPFAPLLSLSALVSLKELFITDNVLEALPEGFGQLPALVKLQVWY